MGARADHRAGEIETLRFKVAAAQHDFALSWRTFHDATFAFSAVLSSREPIEANDFLVTGPGPNVECSLVQARDKLIIKDAVRLYKTGDESRLLPLNQKI